MHRRSHRPAPDRLDVPRRLVDLYPRARTRGRLHVVQPGELWDDDRTKRGLRRIVRTVLFTIFYIPLAIVSGGQTHSGAILLTDAVTRRIARSLFGVRPSMVQWDAWARRRGGRRANDLPPSAYMSEEHVEVPRGGLPTYQLEAGDRRIPLHVACVAMRNDLATHHGAYVAHVELPAEVAARFPGSSLVRRQGLGLVSGARGMGDRLELESIRLTDDAQLDTMGGDPLDWRALMDPALIDLLAEGIHVEWVQRGTSLLLHSPATMSAVRHPEPERLDSLTVAAVAIERRMARIAGAGRPIAAAVPSWRAEADHAFAVRHLKRARQADLAMDIEQQFAELAKYTTRDEVERVREAIDSGRFPVEHLDDLLHHRRAQAWGVDAA